MITILGIILAAILSGIGVGIAWVLRSVVRLGEDIAVIRQELTPAGDGGYDGGLPTAPGGGGGGSARITHLIGF